MCPTTWRLNISQKWSYIPSSLFTPFLELTIHQSMLISPSPMPCSLSSEFRTKTVAYIDPHFFLRKFFSWHKYDFFYVRHWFYNSHASVLLPPPLSVHLYNLMFFFSLLVKLFVLIFFWLILIDTLK